jgi:hypothetical protein
MNLPDSFYIALCMTILLVGAVYWVWTQMQYVQRKVNVLENIVYELKTLCAKPDVGPVSPYNATSLDDELHESLRAEVAPYAVVEEMAPYATMEEIRTPSPVSMSAISPMPEDVQYVQYVQEVQEVQEVQDVQEVQEVQEMQMQTPEPVEKMVEPIFDMSHFIRQIDTPVDAEDLQPGGVGSGIVVPSLHSSLDGMTLKELRRLAQQKGISGANDMKKKDLVEAIRAVPIESFLE